MARQSCGRGQRDGRSKSVRVAQGVQRTLRQITHCRWKISARDMALPCNARGIGHAVVSAVDEACFFHTIARKTQIDYEIKGRNPLTENYSVLRPEVLNDADGKSIAHKNNNFLQMLLGYDRVIIAGQAKSHCVAWTVSDLLAEIQQIDTELAKKIFLVEDLTSPVVVPGIVDYTEPADAAFAKAADTGMHVVQSTDPIESWD